MTESEIITDLTSIYYAVHERKHNTWYKPYSGLHTKEEAQELIEEEREKGNKNRLVMTKEVAFPVFS